MQSMFLVLALFSASYAVKIPSHWPVCKLNDTKHNECLKKAIQHVIPDLVKGLPKHGIVAIDPLHLKTIAIKQGTGSVSVNLKLKDMDLMGMRNAVIEKVENHNWKKLVVDVKVPQITAKGQYTIDGKVLVLPITGSGFGELKLDNFTGHGILDFDEVMKNGKAYYRVKKISFDMNCNPLRIRLDNLFGGNKQLGDQMIVFLNENWKEIFQELSPAFSRTLSENFQQTANRFFSKVPKNQITPR